MGRDEGRPHGRLAVVMVVVVVAGLGIASAVFVVGRSAGTGETPGAAQRLAVPAYIQTAKTDDWDRLLAQDATSLPFIVVNVASGPGTAADPAWQDVISRATRSGKRVLGYVDSGYLGSDDAYNRHQGLTRGPAEWREEAARAIDTWHRFYTGIGGIFLDNGTWACGPTVDGVETNLYADLYRELNAHAKSRDATAVTVLNPGVNPKACMEPAADTLVSWEGTAGQYLGTPRPGEATHEFYDVFWNPAPSPDRFWHIVYDVAPDQVGPVLDRARQRGAGYLYVTDDKGDWKQGENPFDDFPEQPYWDEVVTGAGRD